MKIEVIDKSDGMPTREREYQRSEHICTDQRWHGFRCWCLPEVEQLPNGGNLIVHRDLQ